MADDYIEYLMRASPETIGMLGALFTVIGGLSNQGAVNRDKLIAFLLDALANLSPEERQDDRAMILKALVAMMESTQFPGA